MDNQNNGWICLRCNKSNAPWVRQCPSCSSFTITWPREDTTGYPLPIKPSVTPDPLSGPPVIICGSTGETPKYLLNENSGAPK